MRFRAELFHVAIITWRKLLLPFDSSKTPPIFHKENNNKIVTVVLFFFRECFDDFLFRIEKGKGVMMMMMMMMTRVGSIEPITQLGWIIIKERRGKL